MRPAYPDPAATLLPDGDEVLVALRRQIAAIKAQVAAHREVMLAAGLAASARNLQPKIRSV